ncbi:hypothetical protein HUU62_08750 [Rhodoferax sp. 4810]|uniref:Ribonucleotide reductase large subunit C-terminal domain-containing protein n=1 Tax=Thiospirillum jenense TaxID=1653858 RepID=A0A839HE43_9GAMM|nr:hypothetical protein [Thiospirillum jenense]MBB1074498.1 hypothetical protein [Rhodoferax jenense]MBB1125518.1 hypothetical protein [Thiospirillum jenense]
MSEFRTSLGEQIFKARYAMTRDETWKTRSQLIVQDVCGRRSGARNIQSHPLMSKDELRDLQNFIEKFMFLPGGRYIYYAGREAAFYNNCMMYKAIEDSREEWGRLLKAQSDALMSGAGVGCDYSVLRPHGLMLARTGGTASGVIPLLHTVNEMGRNVRQGGSRRSAIYSSLNWQHGDINEFISVKDWRNTPVPGVKNMTYFDIKNNDFDARAPLDGMNISVNYDDEWLEKPLNDVFIRNVEMALRNGEPGFSFNFGPNKHDTLRNACGEVCSADDSDICNLGSINLAAIDDITTLHRVVELATKFLVCGTIRAHVPDEKTLMVREKNRRLGLGLMGVHEWLLKRNYRYEMNDQLRTWLGAYKYESTRAANEHCDRFYLSRPVACRAIAPTGTTSLLAGTTSGLEPLYAVAYKRRWIDGDKRRYQLVIDKTAQDLIQSLGITDPDNIETAIDLANDVERRIAFQAELQRDYVDNCISSTINLPAWGSELNNQSTVKDTAKLIAKYARDLRGLTFYPDGARGGQPITRVEYAEAIGNENVTFEENDACQSGVCNL